MARTNRLARWLADCSAPLAFNTLLKLILFCDIKVPSSLLLTPIWRWTTLNFTCPRTRVHMVLKILKRSSLTWYRNICMYQHKERRLFCKSLSLKKNTTSVRYTRSKFLAKFLLIPRETCTCFNTWIIVNIVWPMTLSDIKQVFDRLFRHLWREREGKLKKCKSFWIGKLSR